MSGSRLILKMPISNRAGATGQHDPFTETKAESIPRLNMNKQMVADNGTWKNATRLAEGRV
jgi:hypothetical protein